MPRNIPRLMALAFLRRTLLIRVLLIATSVLFTAACQSLVPSPAARPAAATNPAAAAAVDPTLRDLLPELAKGHADKVKFSSYATSFLRHLDPPVKLFAQDMGTENKRLLKALQSWAKPHGYDLTFHYTNDPTGRARQAMEKEQGGQLPADSGPDFQRDLLVLMYADYDWQLNLITALLPTVTDPQLKVYLEDSRRIHEAGFRHIRELLAHYKWNP